MTYRDEIEVKTARRLRPSNIRARIKPLTSLVFAALLLASVLFSATIAAAQADQKASQRMDWWRNAKFGMFIHWGVYAVPAGVWEGKPGHAEWIRHTAQIPIDTYEGLATQFNPVQFDADEWAEYAKRAGMKYMVITSKHHDGFCLFDSEYTKWDIGDASPYEKEPLQLLAAACRDRGLRFATYYSIMDWHHPDYLPRRGWSDRSSEGADMDRYTEYAKNQVGEIIDRLNPAILWFDGGWENTWTRERGQEMLEWVRSKDPDVIVNNRLGVGGDYGTPEQHIPGRGLNQDWETCMTMNNHWGYAEYDDNWKSTTTLVRNLVDIVSKGGNYLLNVGPTKEGTFPQPAIDRLIQIGQWMDTYGEAIYGTSASPFDTLPWGRCTAKPGKLYLHVFQWPQDRTLQLPRLRNEVQDAYLLGDGTKLQTEALEEGVAIQLPDQDMPNAIDTVVVLAIQGEPDIAPPPPIALGEDGAKLPALEATIHGEQARLERKAGSDQDNIGYWVDPSDYVTWRVKVTKPGTYRVNMSFATPGDSEYRLSIDGRELSGTLPATGDWATFQTKDLGTVQFDDQATVTVTARRTESGGPYNLQSISVVPAQ